MTRIEKLRSLSVDEWADNIMDYGPISDFCKSDCAGDGDCPHEHECVVRWLNEEVQP